MLFLTDYMLAEAVEPYKWSPVISVVFDIHAGRYASLGKWYNKVAISDQSLELWDTFHSDALILNDLNALKWAAYIG